jgi:preprotein translocase subunit SecA
MLHYLWEKNFLRKTIYLQNRILTLKSQTGSLTNEQIQTRFNYFREKIRNSKKEEKEKLLDRYLVPVFALVREIIYRKLGFLLFSTQIFGGIALHNANISQMNTGEGKTLAAFLPACLNALSGRSIFVVTVNEYLAQRDWNLAKPIFDFFQITSGVNLRNYSSEEKKNLYQNCSVIYTTSSELGFDYLKNNLVTRVEEKKKQDFYYAIIDEVDSILIDEAQNPLIISRGSREKESITPLEYQLTTQLVNLLIEKKDYIVDQKDKNIWLTQKGIEKCEAFYQINNLFSFINQRYNFLLHNSLKAKYFHHRNIDYIIDKEKQKIVLIDSLTGRLVPNRVYGSGIQQAIESKENLPVGLQSKTIATITYQNFFRLFDKLSGMTGTAKSEAEEFRQIYGMEVIAIPPYRKLIRQDHNDLIFWDKESKYKAIIKLIKKNSQTKKRPILIGSPSVEVSEYLSQLLQEEKVPHAKLNAINHYQEAEIISQAGQIGAVTISTNMAGRGTDIVLSEESQKAGGLLVIGVERNASRRIDNQLRGRAGRQGDPGASQFYVSLEDDLLKNIELQKTARKMFFRSEKQIREILKYSLSGKVFDLVISEPQERLRNYHSAHRQHVLNYDLLINHQRQSVYSFREKLLTGSKFLGTKDVVLNQNKEEYPRINFIKKIDNFWSDYLECINKIRTLISVKSWLPQDPQEAFFWETVTLFRKGIQELKSFFNKTF